MGKPGKENSFDGDCDSNLKSQSLKTVLNNEKSKKKKRKGLKEICNSNGDSDVSLRVKGQKKQVSEEISKKEKHKVSEELSMVKKAKKKVKTNENGGTNPGNERIIDGVKNENTGSNLKPVFDAFKVKKYTAELQKKELAAEVLLPQGARLTTVAGIEISPVDVGHALQFLEFCAAFGEVCLNGDFNGRKSSIVLVILKVIIKDS